MDRERERLLFGLIMYGAGAVYCGVALYWYTKGYAVAGIEQTEAAANAER